MLQVGEHLAGYRIESVAGVGGMGAVYRATQLSLERPVALKVVSTTVVGSHSDRERIRRAARHATALEHPHIIPVYEAGEAGGWMFIAMLLVDGPTLAEQIADGELSGREALRILGAIASALDAAHSSRLVHSDVKPPNILLREDGHPYVADFGMPTGSHAGELPETAAVAGSAFYAAPEQLEGQQVTAASDVYSLAAMLFHCLTGVAPFRHPGGEEPGAAQPGDPPPTLAALGIDAPALDEVLARGMARRPSRRQPMGSALVEACARALEQLPEHVLDRAPALPPGVPHPNPTAPSTPVPERAEDPGEAPSQRRRRGATAPSTPVPERVEDPGAAPSQRRRRGRASAATTESDAPAETEHPRRHSRAPAEPTASDTPAETERPRRRGRAPVDGATTRAAQAPAAEAPARRPEAPAPSAPKPRARRPAASTGPPRALLVAAAVAALLVPVGLGYALGGGDPAPPAPQPLRVASASVTMTVPPGWSRARVEVENLDLVAPIGLRRADGTVLVAGRLREPAAGLDPTHEPLRAIFAQPRSDAVRIRGREGLRYSGELTAGGVAWLLLLPDSSGWTTVACRAPGRADLDALCGPPAATLRPLGATGVELGPDAALAATLRDELGSLSEARTAARDPFRAASAAKRGAAARTLATATTRAAAALADATVRPQDRSLVDNVVAALERETGALTRLSYAARRNDREAYRRRRTAVRSAGQATNGALRALRRGGYAISIKTV